MVSANYEAYKSVMRQAFQDGQITPDETAVLDTLRQSLNISAEEHDQIENEVKTEMSGGGMPSEVSDNSNPGSPEPPAAEEDMNVIRPGTYNDGLDLDNEMSNNPGPVGGLDAEPPAGEVDAGAPETLSLEELLKSGKAAYHKNDFQSAIDFFDKAIVMEPENSEALFFRKRSQSKLQESGGGGGGGAAAAPAADVASAPAAAGSMMATGATGGTVVPAGEMRGDPGCSSCNGAGTCRWCKATGSCYWCKGVGHCDKCKGTGVAKGQQCGACAGSGKCHSCKGSGKCYWCQGTGRCSKCNM